MKTLSSFTHPHFVLNLYDFLSPKGAQNSSYRGYLLQMHSGKSAAKLTKNCGCLFQVFMRTNELRHHAVFLSVNIRVSGSKLL